MPRFQNLDPAHRFHSMGAIWRWGVWDRLTGRRRRAPPGPPAPAVEPDLEKIRARDAAASLTWIGHASFYGTLEGTSFLIDPVFSRRIAVFVPRYGRPGFPLSELPPVDVLLVTHCHYDHLDAPSVRALPRSTAVVVPLGLGRWFRRRGFERVRELDRWQSVEVEGLTVSLTPARHWSRRALWDANRSLWGGFVLAGREWSIYHAGDSAYFDTFSEIGRRFPGLDVAILPIGAYAPAWFMERQHMNPEQAGQAFLDLGARHFVPAHWGTFQLTDEPISEPIGRLHAWWDAHAPGDGRRFFDLAVGETVNLSEGSDASRMAR